MRKIAVLTSGGDAPGMNAAIRAVVRCGIEAGFEVYGIRRGYEGLLDADIIPLGRRDVGDIMQRGGTILKTARSARFNTEEGLDRAAEVLNTFGIEGLVVIGGDGSTKGALALSKKGINLMTLPGTIDNDLAYTDYTIGFDTAVSTVLEAIGKVRDTSTSHDRTTVIEVMGRHCGDIALYAGITGGAEYVLLPEKEFDINKIARRVIEGENNGKQHSIIINAEGSGISSADLAKELEKKTGKETRVVILSYLQRGGAPTMSDRLLATLCAEKAINLFAGGFSNRAIGIVSGHIISCDIEEALAQTREFNTDMYNLIGVLAK